MLHAASARDVNKIAKQHGAAKNILVEVLGHCHLSVSKSMGFRPNRRTAFSSMMDTICFLSVQPQLRLRSPASPNRIQSDSHQARARWRPVRSAFLFVPTGRTRCFRCKSGVNTKLYCHAVDRGRADSTILTCTAH